MSSLFRAYVWAWWCALLIPTTLTLIGCATAPPEKTVYQTVNHPVAVSCVPAGTATAAPKVHTPAQLAQVPDGPTRYILTAADYQALYGWSLGAAPVLAACAAAALSPP